MPRQTPINYSVMKQTLDEVKPGTCWRGTTTSGSSLDRLRVTLDYAVECVYADGSTAPSAWIISECEEMVGHGYWVRCADEPLGGTR